MDTALWEMQQAAEQRVQQMRRQSKRIAEEQGHRTAASLRAARPPMMPSVPPLRPSTFAPSRAPEPPFPPKPPKAPDNERTMLLLLTLLLARCGASSDLLLILLYLSL